MFLIRVWVAWPRLMLCDLIWRSFVSVQNNYYAHSALVTGGRGGPFSIRNSPVVSTRIESEKPHRIILAHVILMDYNFFYSHPQIYIYYILVYIHTLQHNCYYFMLLRVWFLNSKLPSVLMTRNGHIRCTVSYDIYGMVHTCLQRKQTCISNLYGWQSELQKDSFVKQAATSASVLFAVEFSKCEYKVRIWTFLGENEDWQLGLEKTRDFRMFEYFIFWHFYIKNILNGQWCFNNFNKIKTDRSLQ